MKIYITILFLLGTYVFPTYSIDFSNSVDGIIIGYNGGPWKEKTELSLSSGVHVEKQNYWCNRALLGVRLKPGVMLTEKSDLRIIPKLGIASVFYTGDALMDFGIEGRIENRNNSPFTFSAGIQPGIAKNFTRKYLHSWYLHIPLSAAWRWLEVQYTPGLSFPMGEKRGKVFAGHSTHSTRFAFLPFSFGVHFRIQWWGYG